MEEKTETFRTDPSLKLMDRVQQTLLYYQYSNRTGQSYSRWIKEYVSFLGAKKVPRNRFQKEIGSFLIFLSKEKKLSGASQKQALNAIAFLYKRVFDIEVDIEIEPVKTRRSVTLPVVMTKQETKLVLSRLKGKHLLMAQLLYGSGLRLMECVRLRVHNLDFKHHMIYVHPFKGGQNRKVMIPDVIAGDLLDQVAQVKKIHQQDLGLGHGHVDLPGTLAHRHEGMEKEFINQYVFPSKKISILPGTGKTGRTHVLESGLQKAVKIAVKKAGIEKSVSCNTFRHSFATHLLENNVNIFTVKELMGHSGIKATKVYTHVMEKKDEPVLSPLDQL